MCKDVWVVILYYVYLFNLLTSIAKFIEYVAFVYVYVYMTTMSLFSYFMLLIPFYISFIFIF